MNTTLVARLAKDGRRVLCGRPNCGAQLAEIELITMGRDLSPSGEWIHFPIDEPSTSLFFSPGWKEENGIWILTQYARKRLQDDLSLAAGNPYTNPRQTQAARERLTSGRSVKHRRSHAELGMMHQGPGKLPAYAHCPRCRGVNRLDSSLLQAP